MTLGVAVVGAGYWGPNLIRNFLACPATELRWVCDLEPDRARKVLGEQTTTRVTDSLDDVLDDPGVDAVAIATPASTHVALGLACMRAGRHVLLEKPLAPSVAEGLMLVEEADRRDVVLMCDHTYCYTPAVRWIRDVIRSGTLGDIQYVDSVRINLGMVQRDIDVFWDLAPHDLSILDFILPDECAPLAVSAQGADPVGVGQPCVGYLTMPMSGGAIAHVSVNWLSPMKIRTIIVGGSKRMLVWDDLNPSQRVSLYDSGVDLTHPLEGEERRQALVSYRAGDMVAPSLSNGEALQGVVQEFATAITMRRSALTDGASGVRVLRILEASTRSLRLGGDAVDMSAIAGRAVAAGEPVIDLRDGAELTSPITNGAR